MNTILKESYCIGGTKADYFPRGMRMNIMVVAHDLGSHLSVDKIVYKITQDFWFVGLIHNISNITFE